MSELSIREKSSILLRQGLIRWDDRNSVERIERRWQIYKSTPQKTPRTMRQKVRVRPG